MTSSLVLVLQTEVGGSLHSVSFICRNLCCRVKCVLKVYINRKKTKQNKPRQSYGRVKKGWWLLNNKHSLVSWEISASCQALGLFWRALGELCAVLTVLPAPLLLDRAFIPAPPAGIPCYVPVPLLTHDFHPDHLFLKITDLVLLLNSALNIYFLYFEKHLDNSF